MKELIKSTTLPTVRMTHLSSEQRELLPLAFGEHGSRHARRAARVVATRAGQGRQRVVNDRAVDGRPG